MRIRGRQDAAHRGRRAPAGTWESGACYAKMSMSHIHAPEGIFTVEEAVETQAGKTLCVMAVDSPLPLVAPVGLATWQGGRRGVGNANLPSSR